MGIFLRQSYNVKPLQWGSPADIEYAVKVNAEKVYDVDPDSIVLAKPLFWGLPCLDYSGKRNDGVNHGAYYNDGGLNFNGSNNKISADSVIPHVDLSTTGNVTMCGCFNRVAGSGASFQGFGVDYSWTEYLLIQFEDTFVKAAMRAVGGKHPEIKDFIDYSGSWVYVCAVKEGENIELFVNGVSKGKDSTTGLNADIVPTAFDIGWLHSNLYGFQGGISEYRVYNCACSADQIALFHALPYGLYQPVIRRNYFFVTNIPVFMHHYNQMRAA